MIRRKVFVACGTTSERNHVSHSHSSAEHCTAASHIQWMTAMFFGLAVSKVGRQMMAHVKSHVNSAAFEATPNVCPGLYLGLA